MVFYGWWMILAMDIIGAYQGGIWTYGIGSFINPLADEFKWTRTEISLGISISKVEAGFDGPILGWLADHIGPRWATVISLVISGSLITCLSFINSLWQFYVVMISICVLPSTSFIPMGTAVANWFNRKIGKAIGFFQIGYAFTGLFTPIVVWLIVNSGWRMAFAVAGVGLIGICAPLALVIKTHGPEHYGLLPDGDIPNVQQNTVSSINTAQENSDNIDLEKGYTESSTSTFQEKNYTLREALRSMPFWLITIAYGLSSFAFSCVIIYIVPYLIEIGFELQVAALGMTVLTLSSFLGRLGFGWLCDYVKSRYVFALSFAIQLIAIFILINVTTPWAIFLALFMFGPGFGGQMSARCTIQREYYGRKFWGTIQGVMLGIAALPSTIGTIFAGWTFDVTGSYRPAFVTFTLFWAIAIVLVLMARPPNSTDIR